MQKGGGSEQIMRVDTSIHPISTWEHMRVYSPKLRCQKSTRSVCLCKEEIDELLMFEDTIRKIITGQCNRCRCLPFQAWQLICWIWSFLLKALEAQPYWTSSAVWEMAHVMADSLRGSQRPGLHSNGWTQTRLPGWLCMRSTLSPWVDIKVDVWQCHLIIHKFRN